MTHVTRDGRPDLPNVRGGVGWVLFTWLSAVVSLAIAMWSGQWIVTLYAANAAICAAGWWLASARWAEWRAVAEGLMRILERQAEE